MVCLGIPATTGRKEVVKSDIVSYKEARPGTLCLEVDPVSKAVRIRSHTACTAFRV